MVPAHKIAEIMSLDPQPQSLAELDVAVSQGLPSASLIKVASLIYENKNECYQFAKRISPKMSLIDQTARLSIRESEITERVARVFAFAKWVWDYETNVRSFLTNAHPMLNGCRPIDVAMTEIGARRVERVLSSLCYGLVT
jgi:putative toxin-antitoxin system antitoxin component (TIGR02293 family)